MFFLHLTVRVLSPERAGIIAIQYRVAKDAVTVSQPTSFIIKLSLQAHEAYTFCFSCGLLVLSEGTTPSVLWYSQTQFWAASVFVLCGISALNFELVNCLTLHGGFSVILRTQLESKRREGEVST